MLHPTPLSTTQSPLPTHMDLKQSRLGLVSFQSIISVKGYGWHSGVLSGGEVRTVRPLGTCQTLGSRGDIGAAEKDGLEPGPGQVVRAAWRRNVVPALEGGSLEG